MIICRLIIFVSVLLFSWQPAFAQSSETGIVGQVLPHLPKIYQDNFVDLRSDIAIPSPSLITTKIKDAYRFDQSMQNLNSKSLDEPIIVGLYSKNILNKGGGNTSGKNIYVANIQPFLNYVNGIEDRGFSWFVTAHELEHLIMNRMNAPVAKVPVYLFEGIACSLGYRFAINMPEGYYCIHSIAVRLGDYSYKDAQSSLNNLRHVEDYAPAKQAGLMWQHEHIGGLFFEFLIARIYRSPDAMFHAWGKVIEDLGNNVNFEVSFKNRFGMTLEQTEIAFLDYIRVTENNPNARFQGTVFQGHE